MLLFYYSLGGVLWGVVVVLSFNLFFEKNNLTLGRLGIGKFLEGPEKGEEYGHNMFRFKNCFK